MEINNKTYIDKYELQNRFSKEKECQTCENRKYKDGSNEGNVSFKAPGHIDPNASAAVVRSHELEHVANARREGNKENKELLSATVTLQTATCPECGKSYVSGGQTTTRIKTTYDRNGNDTYRKDNGQNIDLKL